MRQEIIFIFICCLFVFEGSNQQELSTQQEKPLVADNDLILIFSVSIAVVIGILLYLSRDYILRRKGEYEKKDYESKKNRDYEKYHADWTSEDMSFGESKRFHDNEEFENAMKNSTLPNYYKILGLPRDCSQGEIKNRFRLLVKEWHPDKNKDPANQKKMAQINEAYEVLSDPDKKAQYDKFFMS